MENQNSRLKTILSTALTMANIVFPEHCEDTTSKKMTPDFSPPSPIELIDLTSPSTSRASSPELKMTMPALISPLRITPPRWSEPISKKLEKLKTLRRKSFALPNPCSYVFKKGARKGEKCIKPCVFDEKLCKLDLLLKEKVFHPPPNQSANYFKTRINRLAKFKKYFFTKLIKWNTVILKCEERKYILKLPRGMVNPENPSKKHYLIRESEGTAVWKTS